MNLGVSRVKKLVIKWDVTGDMAVYVVIMEDPCQHYEVQDLEIIHITESVIHVNMISCIIAGTLVAILSDFAPLGEAATK